MLQKPDFRNTTLSVYSNVLSGSDGVSMEYHTCWKDGLHTRERLVYYTVVTQCGERTLYANSLMSKGSYSICGDRKPASGVLFLWLAASKNLCIIADRF